MKNFLSQFQSWAHWFAGVVIAGATIYVTNDAAHKAVNSALGAFPKVSGIVASAAAIVLAFANAKKTQ